MTARVSCTTTRFVLEDGSYERVRLGDEGPRWWLGVKPATACHDCGVPLRGLHHPGCDMEMCPRCRGQLISCGCWEDVV
jgi:hypothetical protein